MYDAYVKNIFKGKINTARNDFLLLILILQEFLIAKALIITQLLKCYFNVCLMLNSLISQKWKLYPFYKIPFDIQVYSFSKSRSCIKQQCYCS